MPSKPISLDHDFQGANRVVGLPLAIANGQAVPFEQVGTATTQYEGGFLLLVLPGNGVNLTALGTVVTTSGTISHSALATTNVLTQTRRSTLTGAATAGTVIFVRQASTLVFRGNATNRGGFRLAWRFGLETLAVGNRAFFGLSDSVANPTNIDPLTSPTIGKVGLAISASTGNWQLVSNIAGTAPTVLDLGTNFPVNVTDILELVLAALPNAAGIDYAVTNKASGAIASGTLTTNIPSNTTFLAPVGWMTNNATAAAFAFALGGLKLTSP